MDSSRTTLPKGGPSFNVRSSVGSGGLPPPSWDYVAIETRNKASLPRIQVHQNSNREFVPIDDCYSPQILNCRSKGPIFETIRLIDPMEERLSNPLDHLPSHIASFDSNMDSSRPTLPKKGPSSFNVCSSVGSGGLPPQSWDYVAIETRNKASLPRIQVHQNSNREFVPIGDCYSPQILNCRSKGPIFETIRLIDPMEERLSNPLDHLPSHIASFDSNMDSSRPTLPKEGPSSFNVHSSVGSGRRPPPSWGSAAIKTLNIAGGRMSSQVGTMNSYSQVYSGQTEGSLTKLLLESEEFSFDSSPWTNNMTSFKEPGRDGSSSATVDHHPIYNLNSPPRNEVGASSSGTSSFQFPVATPDHTRQLDTGYQFNMFNWTRVTSQEKDRHASLSVPAENVVYKSVPIVSAEQVTERIFLQKEGDRVMDLSKTPTQTIPRRRRHRPKVIIEGKPKITPKAAEALQNRSPPLVKRKYVRKNNLTLTEGGSTSKEQPSGKRKYERKNELNPPKAKKSLNFDLGKEQSLEDNGEPGNKASLYAIVRSKRNRGNHIISEDVIGLQKEKKIGKPKVDLDPETDRALKFLMGRKVSEGNEAEDEKREKWWEAERKVFQGRVECFNARMHLIQGDRRFTKWKGSVVDSVVGVFLTQNVADHLSSSAYMSLAAKFPIRKESQIQTGFQGEPSVILGEPDEPADSDHPNSCFQEHDEDLSWLQPNSKTETNRKCISSTTVLHEDQTEAFEKWWDKSNFQNSVDQYMPTNGGEKFTSTGAFLGTTFYHSNEIKPTISEKATEDFNVFEIEKTYFLSPDWSAVHTGAPSSKEHSADATRKRRKQRCSDALDSMDYEALRKATKMEIAETIKDRGLQNVLATRMKDFLDRLVSEHGAIDLEWLRDAPQDKAKDYLLSIEGLGLKSTECVRLLTLHHIAFPVDINVARIAVRLGWVPIQPLPESLQLHLLEKYPVLDSIQKYLWTRLCKLDQPTLYELHYQMITFGKVFCTKIKPNCNACPMRGECRHFASAFASSRLALPGQEERRVVKSTVVEMKELPSTYYKHSIQSSEPIIEEPASPEPERNDVMEIDMEDAFYQDSDDIPTIKLNLKEFTQNLHSYMQGNVDLQGCDLSKALVALTPDVASIPTAKLKNVSRLKTEHQVYELPDSHPLLEKMKRREQDDPSPYLLAIWTPGETASTTQVPERNCGSQNTSSLCNQSTCLSCNSIRKANAQIVRGTLLVPCRTAMMGSFPLNGTYFQVNEVFADHESSFNPISVQRSLLWNLPRKTVYFGTSVSSICRGMSREEIQQCFLRGYVCVRGFDEKTRTPRPLIARLHFSKSESKKENGEKVRKSVKKTKKENGENVSKPMKKKTKEKLSKPVKTKDKKVARGQPQ